MLFGGGGGGGGGGIGVAVYVPEIAAGIDDVADELFEVFYFCWVELGIRVRGFAWW